MPTKSLTPERQNTRVELIMLAAASLGCVTVLTATIASGRRLLEGGGFPGGTWLLAGLVAVAGMGTVYLLFRTLTVMRRQAARSREEARRLRRALAASEALIKAEPQALLHWEQGKGFSVVTHTLTGVPGFPANTIELIRFGFWLDQKSHTALKSALDGLLAEGRAFNLILKTLAGGHVEADGRAAGGRAVLRFKDVAGYKRDLSVILDQHMRLARDVRASRALLSALPHPAWLRDQTGRLTWVNAAYIKAVDAESEAEVVDGQIELLETRQRKAVARVLKMGDTFKERMPLVVGSERKSHEVTVLPLGDATAGAAIDVADVESVKGELDRQVAAYDKTLDRVATAVAIFNTDRKLTFFNAAYQKLWELDTDWLQSGPTDGMVLDRLREFGRLPEVVNYREWKTKVLRCYTDETEQEDWWHLPDGRRLHVMAAQRPDGGVTYLYEDETERLELESNFKQHIDVQTETLNALKEGVAVFATDGRLSLFNSAFASIWRLSPQQLSEHPHIDAFVRVAKVLFDEPAKWSEIVHIVTSFDARDPVEGQMLRPDNSVIDYAAAPLPDGGTLLTFVDVTDSKRYERALIERNEALETADKLKNQFIGHISYELRTPLTNIIGFSELLANPIFGDLTSRQKDYLDDIAFSSKTLLQIIDDILDLATIDAGGLELKLETVDARALIDRAIGAVRERAARARLTLDIAIADDATTFMADPERTRQVLSNLLSNAVGFSKPEGVIHISCWREAGAMVFSVEDQGVGIPKEQQRRIFNRFESMSQGGKHRGAGLGLSIVKSLVDLHGGDMVLDSEPGRGTKVTVRFPERGLEQEQDGSPATPTTPRVAEG
ncbi:histidine kinase [Hyphomicrobium nitrativorans NL23]|uniref:histidine kinase n=1 Tax=Hyphomicrobium nitrativorans NL23 TaxID=1029756 RepID=V5SI52_9HYPH|nr:PAS domain-containing sensor histidine kinase [Hyphomicrobium nitrativorans]AHB49725.1 histidine kinase [Hyphomicrobium nitrativorans NL23]